MSCCNHKECNCHQNSSFIIGLFIGLIIGAIIAIVIYKNDKEKVFINLKKKLANFFDVFLAPTFNKKTSPTSTSSPVKSTSPKIAVTLPPELIKKESESKAVTPKSKPRVFKK